MPKIPGTIPGRPNTRRLLGKLNEPETVPTDSREENPTDPREKKRKRRKYNIGGRANLLEEMGRIDARKHPDAADRAEKRRVIGELNRGYKSGGAVLKGKKVGIQIK